MRDGITSSFSEHEFEHLTNCWTAFLPILTPPSPTYPQPIVSDRLLPWIRTAVQF